MTALDASFLRVEHGPVHMHVGAVCTFDARPLTLPHGGIDIGRIVAYVEARLDQMPRYRQRLHHARGLGRPVWVDDDGFDIRFHIRHTALPRPGSKRQLERLAGRIYSQRLDRNRPLWEFWVVEGLEGDRFALVTKVHHCMIDGIAGMDLLTVLLRGTDSAEIPEHAGFSPRPLPTWREVARGELAYRARGAGALLEEVRHGTTGHLLKRARASAAGVVDTVRTALRSAPPTPLNPGGMSPYRRFDWFEVDLDRIKAIKNALGGKVNDVVLAAVAGAMRKYLARSGCDPDGLGAFRALVPVNIREPGSGDLGNRVGLLLAELPLDEPDPVRRLERVRDRMTELKSSPQVRSAELIENLSDFTSAALVADVLELAFYLRAYNVLVTNIPGPPFPLYLLGSRMTAIYPVAPLFAEQSLAIGLVSNAGRVFWGLNADWDAVRDLHEVTTELEGAIDELADAAGLGAEPERPAPPPEAPPPPPPLH